MAWPTVVMWDRTSSNTGWMGWWCCSGTYLHLNVYFFVYQISSQNILCRQNQTGLYFLFLIIFNSHSTKKKQYSKSFFFFFWLNAVLFTLCMPKDSHRYLYYFNAILFLPMMGQNLKFPLIINSPCLFIYFFNKVKYFMLLKCVTTTLLLYIYIYIYIVGLHFYLGVRVLKA